jgi:hypothetical protein
LFVLPVRHRRTNHSDFVRFSIADNGQADCIARTKSGEPLQNVEVSPECQRLCSDLRDEITGP